MENLKLHSRILYINFQLLCVLFSYRKEECDARDFDIIMALVDRVPWFVTAYIVYKAYENKPKLTSISIPDKVTIISER